MDHEKVYAMSFGRIYPLLAAKAEKKGRTQGEVNEIICWLTGYSEEQIEGAFDEMEERLALVGLNLENVVQMNCLFKNIWDIPVMERVVKRRFHGKNPARKSIQTEFADPGKLFFQVDAVAYSASPGCKLFRGGA